MTEPVSRAVESLQTSQTREMVVDAGSVGRSQQLVMGDGDVEREMMARLMLVLQQRT
jgi:hypothetical protein